VAAGAQHSRRFEHTSSGRDTQFLAYSHDTSHSPLALLVDRRPRPRHTTAWLLPLLLQRYRDNFRQSRQHEWKIARNMANSKAGTA
jgi:hypothetical protein